MRKLTLLTAALAAGAVGASAAPTSLFGIGLATDPSAKSASIPMQIVILLSILTLLPAIVMCVTPFLRITLVLHFLRQALGTQTVPSNQVLIGLSLFLTLLVMNPVVQKIYTTSWKPLDEGKITMSDALDQGSKPLKQFLLRFAREKDLRLFVELSHSPRPANAADVSLEVLIPAYIISELRTGFQIGAILYLPFLVIDLVVASITVSIGMMQLPPALVSAPFKILLFVLVDGWALIASSLVRSFG
ncbi:MAG: flagellar type III secretion system pore protein FliP [Acidobacteriaceae bacterium]|nr:flagellar type III secretion system pore protein FliP [Acidobacteriaceae bacterium]